MTRDDCYPIITNIKSEFGKEFIYLHFSQNWKLSAILIFSIKATKE